MGFPSWMPGSFTGPESIGMSRLRGDIAAGGLHLVWQGSHALATFSLLERDLLYWQLELTRSICTDSPCAVWLPAPGATQCSGPCARRIAGDARSCAWTV